MAVDASGSLFIADTCNERIRRVDAVTGIISTVAGDGFFGFSGDGGQATSAELAAPLGVAVDASGNILIADTYNERIRRVDAATGIITTVAGGGSAGLGDGGPATSAQLDSPFDVAVDDSGNMFIADTYHQRIRRVDGATGIITTVAGDGVIGFSGDGGPATSAEMFLPYSVTVDSSGNFLIADTGNTRIRRVDASTGIITTVVGDGSFGFSGDGGPATNAELANPYSVAVDASGNVFIADFYNDRIRRVDGATAIISTVAGNGSLGDGGPATSAELNLPNGTAVDSSGNLFIADTVDSLVRRVDLGTGIITTVAGGGLNGLGDGGPATSAELAVPHGVAVDDSGNLFIADYYNQRIRRVDAATGIITSVAGDGVFGFSGDGGPATSAELASPFGVAVDASGNIFIADSDNERIRRVDAATGIITTVAGDGVAGFGGDGGPATSAQLNLPLGVAVDTFGDVFIADENNSRMRRVDAGTGVITTVAGDGVAGFSGDGGPATGAELYFPAGVAVDATGNLFIADTDNSRIRRVDAVTGIIITVAGVGTVGFSGDGGPATSADLNYPSGVAVDSFSNLYTADTNNLRIRSVNLAPVATLSTSGLTFGDQALGTTSAAQNVTLTNSGLATLTITSIAPSSDFGQTTICGGSVAPSLSCTISVTFTPTATGTRTGSITITDDASDSPQIISLTGTGTAPSVSLSPTSLTFAKQLVGTTSKAKTVTLTNSGTASLTITSIASSGDFAQTSACPISPSTLAAGANCTISVSFKPTAAGIRTGTLTITDNNNGVTGSTQTVNLTGTGTVVKLVPAGLNFGSVPVGTTSRAKKVTLTNAGSNSLAITSIAVKGADSHDFAETNTCGSSVAAGGSCVITVTFTPKATGTRTGVISVSDNGGGSPQVVTLIGTGT